MFRIPPTAGIQFVSSVSEQLIWMLPSLQLTTAGWMGGRAGGRAKEPAERGWGWGAGGVGSVRSELST